MRAFTLLETMVALAIFAIMITSVVATFSGTIELQGRSREQWTAYSLAAFQHSGIRSLEFT